ncbi:MAG: ribonuclease P protein component 2 [Candidatus Aenigmarchaeota archaeon]|nr:ribonuclease P protein component 2 [Candidatus Aenigmarchaeota archaeon]
MDMPKILPPTLRQNKRYIAFEVISEHPIQYNELVSAVWNSMFTISGEMGASDAGVWFVKNLYDEKAQKGLIKCAHDKVENMRVTLSLIHIISESKAVIKILGVTGTIKSAQKKYLAQINLTKFTREEQL